jgi:hypothetical protein
VRPSLRTAVITNLPEIYGEINKLETTEIEELKFYDYDENTDHSYGCWDC